MSESPVPTGDSENVVDIKRPAENDDGVAEVPKKYMKVNEKAEQDATEDDDYVAELGDDNQEQDDEEDVPEEDLDFGDEEEDGEEGDFEQPAEENIFDETGESSTDLEEFIQTNLAYIDDCQSDIDTLNQKANDEILKVEQKYNKLRQPVYNRRNSFIERIPNFWASVFSRHPQLKRVLTREDLNCLKSLSSLQIDDFEDSRSGYRIRFKFSENMWFTNKTITKEYHLPWHESPSCECTPVNWKPGMNLTLKPSSFFSWFCPQDDASTDDIAEIIKEELWPNPLQCYLMKEKPEEESSDESEEEEEEGAVYVDDDGAEYISSDDGSDGEEWRRPAALGKEAPSTSRNEELYVVDDDDEENDDVVEYDDEDEVINVSSDGNYGYNEEELDKPDEINDDEGKEFDDEDDDGFIDESLDKNVVNSSANNHSHTTGNVTSSSHPVSALKEQIMTPHEQNETNDIQAEPTPSQSSTTALTSSGDTET